MNHILTLLLSILSCYAASAQSTCATALPILLGITEVDTVDGIDPPQLICPVIHQETALHAVWYSYTATADTTVMVSTDVAGQPSVNTRLHIYTGTCGALECLIGNDDGGPNFTSRAAFQATAGETYLIAFDDRWSSEGFSVEVREINYLVYPAEVFVSFQNAFAPLQPQPLGVVDMDNDNRDDIVGVQLSTVNIGRQLPEGGFGSIEIQTPQALFMPTWSMAAGDLNADGHKDLLYGNGYGVSIMLSTEEGLGFIQSAGPEYVFSQRTNMVDINNDGHLDAFVCHDVAPNVFYLNDGSGNFTIYQGGLGNSCGNYGSIWVDYDNDGDQDCFVAKCGCDPADLLLRNDGNGVFTNVAPGLGLADGHQSWSSAWGDFDNDGDMDALIGSNGSNFHKLLQNNGDGTFANALPGSGMETLLNQSREWTTHDFNNDGWLDILGGELLFINNKDMSFTPNTYQPGSGAVGDLNSDGFLDVIGLAGLRLNSGNDNHWLRINPIGTVSNRSGIGARLTLTSALGTQIREVRSGDGFKYMSSLMVHFGLGADTEVQELTVLWPSGIEQTVEVSAIDTVINVVEPLSTGVAAAVSNPGIRIYPNPATDRLSITSASAIAGMLVTILDASGRVVMNSPIIDGGIELDGELANGMYMVNITAGEQVYNERLVIQR